MKKIICLIILLFLFILYSCKETTITFDKDNPQNIIIDYSNLEIVELYDNNQPIKCDYIISVNQLIISSSSLLKLREGNYILKLNNSSEYSLIIKGMIKNIPSIQEKDFFTSSHYIYFYQQNCSYCEKVQPYLFDYYDYSFCYDEIALYTFDATNSIICGDNENILDVKNIDDLKIESFPLLIIIDNNKIVDYYKGANNIINFLSMNIQ